MPTLNEKQALAKFKYATAACRRLQREKKDFLETISSLRAELADQEWIKKFKEDHADVVDWKAKTLKKIKASAGSIKGNLTCIGKSDLNEESKIAIKSIKTIVDKWTSEDQE